MIVFSLKYKDRLFYQALQPGQKLTFGSGSKDTVRVLDMTEKQITISANADRVSVCAPNFNQDNAPIGTSLRIDSTTGTSLFLSRATGMASQHVTLPHDGIVTVGRADSNDIAIGLPFVSGRHFQLRITDGGVRVEDLDSTNGLYLNGLRIKAAMMRSGDVLNILTVRVKMVNGELHFENVGNTLKITRTTQKTKAEAAGEKPSPDKILRFRLSPRIQDRLPQDTIVLDRPPKKGQEYHPSGSRIASMISMGASAGASLAMGAVSPALAFSRVFSVAAGIYNMAAGSKMDKQRQAEMEEYNRRREEEYKTYIEAQRARIMAVAEEQRRIISNENPEPAECLKMVQRLDRRLWERMPGDRDFLDVRLGMGYEDLCVPIKNYAENRGLMMEDDELEDLCNNIAEESRIVDYVPARLSMRTTPTVGIIGNRDQAVHLVRNMLVSLTTHHCHKDVQVVGIFDNSERARWAALRWLPHIWDSSRQFRFLAYDEKRAHSLCEMLYDTLRRRLEKAGNEYGKNTPAPTPHYVIILGSRNMVCREPLMELLTANDPRLGVTTLFLYDDLYDLPQQCGYFIDLTDEYPSAYGKHDANRRFVFSRDPAVSNTQFSAFARRIAAVELEDNRLSSALPSSVPFLEGLGVETVEQLNVLNRWRGNKVTDSLAAPIGVLATGKPFCLDIHYKAHGAHGLLAGTTGSGKSELLRTWILSMAVNYHPHEVNFVIIDYKGGGMANKLEALPHVVGKITNIDTNISRTLVSLKQETKRRMKVLENHPGVDDIDQYMQLYYAGKVHQPMPHLIIVSDEFAELKKEEPEFMKELSSLARVGRSVGVHLLLATQRPTGIVDDQIDSNSRFRICMKVNSIQDSKEIIKKPDAAAITQRGRAYVRVGEDEMFELFQSYWSGAEYIRDRSAERFGNQVSIVDVSGERIQPNSGTAAKKQQIGADQLTAIVNHIVQQAELARISPLPGPWKPELPTMLSLQDLDVSFNFDGKGWSREQLQLRVPIGMFDRPAMQEQGVQYMDFSQKPHYGIYGGPASGKTTLLKTMILSMGMSFSPADVNLYILDFGGRSLSDFRDMPHTAMVIHEDEESKLMSFFGWLTEEISSRKVLFEKEKAANFDKYRQKKKDLPAIFVVIDNLLRLSTLYNEVDQMLIEVSMMGSDCGVHLVFTTNNINKVGMNLRTNIGGNIALHMTDYNDYRVAISEFPEGSRAPVNPGRALVRDASAAEFQTAVFLASEDDEKNKAALEELLQKMRDCWDGPKINPVKTMPDVVTVEDMEPHYTVRNSLPLGLNYQNMEPVYVDLREKQTLLITDCDHSEAPAALCAVAQLLLTRQDNLVYVLDGSGALKELAENQSVVYASGMDALNHAVSAVEEQLHSREDALFALQDSGKDFAEEEFALQYPQLCILIDSMHLTMEKLSEDQQQLLLSICENSHNLGVIAIADGCKDEIMQYMCTEDLTIAFVDSPVTTDADASAANWQKGLCMGGKVRDHDYFVQPMLSDEEKSAELLPGDGMVFDCGKAIRVKRMQQRKEGNAE